MLEAVEKAGVFHGYLEDLAYTPKTLKAPGGNSEGRVGQGMWARSRETHSGPHSAWFWTKELSGGRRHRGYGLSLHRNRAEFHRQRHPPRRSDLLGRYASPSIEAEDHAVGLVRYENGAIGQFETSWTFRGGMDLRDEISGTDGTIWLNHWMRTGFEMFTSIGQGGYVAEKAEGDTGWLFPVGDEIGSLGYVEMFLDMFNSMDKGAGANGNFLRWLYR